MSNRGCARTVAGAALTVLSLVATVEADVVHLTNGNAIQGRIVAETPDQIVVELPYGLMTIDPDDIERIERESETETLRGAAESLLRHKDYERSIHFLEQAFEKSGDAKTRSDLIDAYEHAIQDDFERKRYSLARRRIERARRVLSDAKSLESQSNQLESAMARRDGIEKKIRRAGEKGELEEILVGIEEISESFPEEREKWREQLADVSIALGHRAMNGSDFETARRHYHAALIAEPDTIELCRVPLAYAEITLARALMQKGELRPAANRLEEAYAALPSHAAIAYHLALCYEGTGKLEEAGHLYRQIAGPNGKVGSGDAHVVDLRRAAEQAIVNADRGGDPNVAEKKPSGRVGRYETKHFIIEHRSLADAKTAGQILESRLASLQKRWFRGQTILEKKVRVVLHASRRDYLGTGFAPEWSDGVARQGRRLGRIYDQELHFDSGAPQFESAVVPHELAHIALPHRVGLGAQIPMWIEEGFATNEEPEFKQEHYRRRVSDAIASGDALPLAQLFRTRAYPRSDAEVERFYAQSHSVIEFLVAKIGTQGALALAREMSTSSADDALRKHTRWVNAGALETAWVAAMEKSGR